jgi:hypothetical protein
VASALLELLENSGLGFVGAIPEKSSLCLFWSYWETMALALLEVP